MNTEDQNPSAESAVKKRFSFSARGVCASGNKFSCSGVLVATDAMEAVVLADKCVTTSFGPDAKTTKIDVKEKRK
jgi:type II secretory pathway component PulC